MGSVIISTLILFAALAVTLLINPQTTNADESDVIPDSFAVCAFDLDENAFCYDLNQSNCGFHATKCGWSSFSNRCLPIAEYNCRYKWSQFGYSRYCHRSDEELLPLFSETDRCQGPGSDQYKSFHYFHENDELLDDEPDLDAFMLRIGEIIGLIHIENGYGHAIRHVSIQDKTSSMFSQVPDRFFANLRSTILAVYTTWEEFASDRFPADFKVYITANQTRSWSSSDIQTPEMQPRFTFRLSKGAGIDQYFPVSCEEIGGIYLRPVVWIPGLQTICALHTNDQCERREFVNPNGGVWAYWERIAGSTCDGVNDI
jgi:hypothetical protein